MYSFDNGFKTKGSFGWGLIDITKQMKGYRLSKITNLTHLQVDPSHSYTWQSPGNHGYATIPVGYPGTPRN